MIFLQDPKLLAALAESQRRQAPYAGAFLVKDEPDSETEKNIYDLKGQELLNRLHEVGTLAQVILIGYICSLPTNHMFVLNALFLLNTDINILICLLIL